MIGILTGSGTYSLPGFEGGGLEEAAATFIAAVPRAARADLEPVGTHYRFD